MTRDSLALAIEALSWMAYTGIGERSALLNASKQLDISIGGDLRQAHKWIMETTRFQNRLDSSIAQTTGQAITESASHGVRSLFRLVAYLRFVESKPKPELVRVVGWARQIIGWQELRPYETRLAELVHRKPNSPSGELDDFEKVGLETCHPAWYVARLMRSFGRTTSLKILKRDLFPVSSFARINELKINKNDSLAEQLRAKGSAIENVYILGKLGGSDTRAELASSGKIVIQDFASIVAGLAASPQPGQTVLDMCAAPGNKTSHLAAQMRNEGKIYSIELSQTRSVQWKKEMARTGSSIASLVRADGRQLPLNIHADLALVDPPCSNSGVFARNPASKWRITPTRLKELVQSQSLMLQVAADRLREAGTLVYCTCSILPEEDELVVENFLKKNSTFSLTLQSPFLGSQGLRGLSMCQRFYPHLHNCNGYFIAKLRRS